MMIIAKRIPAIMPAAILLPCLNSAMQPAHFSEFTITNSARATRSSTEYLLKPTLMIPGTIMWLSIGV
jgi:hypothetical protein